MKINIITSNVYINIIRGVNINNEMRYMIRKIKIQNKRKVDVKGKTIWYSTAEANIAVIIGMASLVCQPLFSVFCF